MRRIISEPTAPVPTYVCDTKAELQQILKEQFDGNTIGISALCIEDGNVYMLDGNHEWHVL